VIAFEIVSLFTVAVHQDIDQVEPAAKRPKMMAATITSPYDFTDTIAIMVSHVKSLLILLAASGDVSIDK